MLDGCSSKAREKLAFDVESPALISCQDSVWVQMLRNHESIERGEIRLPTWLDGQRDRLIVEQHCMACYQDDMAVSISAGRIDLSENNMLLPL